MIIIYIMDGVIYNPTTLVNNHALNKQKSGIPYMQQARFICDRHRQWLLEDVNRAEVHWRSWIDLALADNSGISSKARLLRAGCAWDLSGELLHKNMPCEKTALERFTLSCLQLLRLLLVEEHTDVAGEIAELSNAKLSALAGVPQRHDSAVFCLKAIQLQQANARASASLH
ncbi:MAG: hypothetical protein AB8B48_16745 [Pseudomonadales bacterium]